MREGLVDGLRIDHPDGLADPRGYLERLRARGAARVWVEKILEPGERLRDWPVEGTTGYEFLNDAMHLFVDPRAEERLTRLYAELTGETRTFAEMAAEAKLEQARTTFAPEVERLRRLWDAPELRARRSRRSTSTGRTSSRGRAASRTRTGGGSRRPACPRSCARTLLLEERGRDEFVTRFQQTTGPVHAKGVEDTAFYRYFRLAALNEVGGDPGRFGLDADAFHQENINRVKHFPGSLLTTFTHDTKRSPDVRARLVALTWVPEAWEALVRAVGAGGIDPNDAYLALQTVVGAWPISPARLDAYLEKALREGKRTSNWLDPDTGAEDKVKAYARGLLGNREVERFVELVRPLGERIALGMLALKLTAPGVPDLYQGDELEALALVDPDNRRPVDWDACRRALDDPPPKLALILHALDLRRRVPDAFAGAYEPLAAGPDRLAFVRGGNVQVTVPLRADSAAGRRAYDRNSSSQEGPMSVRTDTVVVSLTGEMQTGPLERFLLVLRQALGRAGASARRERRRGQLRRQRDRPRVAEAVPPPLARHLRRRDPRARLDAGRDRGLAQARVPDARARAREHRPLLRPRPGGLVHDDGARPLPRRGGRRPRRRSPTRSSPG